MKKKKYSINNSCNNNKKSDISEIENVIPNNILNNETPDNISNTCDINNIINKYMNIFKYITNIKTLLLYRFIATIMAIYIVYVSYIYNDKILRIIGILTIIVDLGLIIIDSYITPNIHI